MFSIRCNSCVKLRRKKKNCKKITKIKHFVNKYNWDGMNFSSEKDDQKKIEKNNKTIDVLYPRKKKYILLMFENITQTMKNQLFF